jgi:hypothetical protein
MTWIEPFIRSKLIDGGQREHVADLVEDRLAPNHC